MKRTRKSSSITVKVGRFNEKTEEVTLPASSTIEDVLERADISLGSSESLWIDGEKASVDDVVEDGDFLQIVGKKEGGIDPEEEEKEEEEEEEEEEDK